MAENSKIEWTTHTFNVWEGCEKVSPGCTNCYAERRDKQYHGGGHWGPNGTRKMMSEAYWKQPLKWNVCRFRCSLCGTWNHPNSTICAKEKCFGESKDFVLIKRPRVFCSSLADVFEDRPELAEPRERLFQLIDRTPNLDWLLLTKRPQNIEKLWPWGWYDDQFTWPNIWIGTTVENQEQADKRISELLKIPAKVRFLSCEPLLGPVDISGYLPCSHCRDGWVRNCRYCTKASWIDWVIAGGESGPNARPMHPKWARSLRDQCQAAGVPFHFKQWGEWGPHPVGDWDKEDIQWLDDMHVWRVGKKAAGRVLDGQTWNELPAF